MNTKILCLFAVVLVATAHAQTRIEVGYSGATITHPGLNAGVYHPLATVTNERKNTNHQFLFGVQSGFYFHKDRHSALYLNTSVGWIKTCRSGFQYGLEFPIGILRTFIPNVYKVSSDGKSERVRFAGTRHFILSPAIRFGHSYKNQTWINGWYIKPRVMYITPYVGGSTAQFFLEAGIVKNLN